MYIALFFLSVLIASISQILLKKSALKQYDNKWAEYLNPYVIFAYGLLFVSMFMTVIAYRGVDLKTGPAIEASSYVFVAILSAIFLNESINKKKKLGLVLIIIGVIVSNL